MTRFCLIRHGQTDWNMDGRYQGQSDIPLNEKGLAQAKTLAGELQGRAFTSIYSSDLMRARQTAQPIADALKLTVQLEPRLREINQGEWEGQVAENIKARYADLWAQRTIDPASVRPPGGETVAEVAARVYAALNDISRRHSSGTIMIVSHGLCLAVIICRVRDIPIEKSYTLIPDNIQPFWIDWVES